MINLENQTAIVTGGISGIGAAISLKLAGCGADVLMIDRKHEEDAVDILKKITGMGRKAMFIQSDISDFASAENAVKRVVLEFGRLDILVNNAGINRDGVVWKMTEKQWDEVILSLIHI